MRLFHEGRLIAHDLSHVAQRIGIARAMHNGASRFEVGLQTGDLSLEHLDSPRCDHIEPPAGAGLDLSRVLWRIGLYDEAVVGHPSDAGIQRPGPEEDRTIRALLDHPLDVITVGGLVRQAEEDVKRRRRERASRSIVALIHWHPSVHASSSPPRCGIDSRLSTSDYL